MAISAKNTRSATSRGQFKSFNDIGRVLVTECRACDFGGLNKKVSKEQRAEFYSWLKKQSSISEIYVEQVISKNGVKLIYDVTEEIIIHNASNELQRNFVKKFHGDLIALVKELRENKKSNTYSRLKTERDSRIREGVKSGKYSNLKWI